MLKKFKDNDIQQCHFLNNTIILSILLVIIVDDP